MVQLPIKGQLHFNQDTDNFEIYDGLNWRVIVDDDLCNIRPKWEKCYTWRPVRIQGKWYWLDYVYRKFILSPGGGFWKYGTLLDVLKEA